MTTDRKVVNYKPLTLVRGSWLKVCDLNELDVLITDEQLTKKQRKWFRSDTQILYAK